MTVRGNDVEAGCVQPLEAKADSKTETKQDGQKKSLHLTLLDAPRWIASAHVVGYHYYEDTIKYFYSGGVWTQFFFLLGGFLLAYSEMTRPVAKRPAMTTWQYVRKRLITIYPLYVFSLLLMLFTMAPRTTFNWVTLPLHFMLLQAILPISWKNENGVREFTSWEYNPVCWFLSALMVYWILLRPLSRCCEKLSLRACYGCLVVLWLWSLVPTAAFVVTEPMEWHSIVMNLVKANPLGFIHVFVSGIVTARVFVLTCLHDAATGAPPTASFKQLMAATDGAPLLFRWGCSVGYSLWAIIAIILVLSPQNETYYIFFHTGGALPSMVLVLLGSAVGVDPIARIVFQCRVFKVLAQLSYAQYVLQIPVAVFLSFYLVPESSMARQHIPSSPQKPVFLMVYPVVLLCAAYLAERFISRPYVEWQRAQERQERVAGQGFEGKAQKSQAVTDVEATKVASCAAGRGWEQLGEAKVGDATENSSVSTTHSPS